MHFCSHPSCTLSGMVLTAALALALGLPFPVGSSLLWAFAAGSIGGIAVAIFYRALASGQMGLVAPVSAVLGAAIPNRRRCLQRGLPGNAPSLRLSTRRSRRLADLARRKFGARQRRRAHRPAAPRPRHGHTLRMRLRRLLSLHPSRRQRIPALDRRLLPSCFPDGDLHHRHLRSPTKPGEPIRPRRSRSPPESSTSPAPSSSSAPANSDASIHPSS